MKLISVLLLSSLTQLAMANLGKIEEEVYVPSITKAKFNMILSHPEFSVDHMNSSGFELYGPKGMKTWLTDIGIRYSEAHIESHSSHGHKSHKAFADYPTFPQIENNLKKIVASNPSIAKLFSIGKSVEGRDLYVVKISDNVEVDELEPEFKYISSMHGDEITGRELTQFLIKDLVEGYNKDSKITKLINNTEIYIMVSMNPDGSKRKRRANANGYDLNRNFPDWTKSEPNSIQNRQPETLAVMRFQASRQFSLSANFHGGAVVANYPWDATYDRHPFDGLVRNLSLKYAGLNPDMRRSREFSGGVTNGADWYVLHGGMQDWSYFWHNDLQITIELSDKKWPRYRNIPGFYKDNKDSMIAYAESIHQGAGIKLVNSKKNGKVVITKNNSDGSTIAQGSYGFNSGEFYKVLPIGNYTFKVQVEGSLKTVDLSVEVNEAVNQNGNYYKVNL
jgi:hypothetical protein